MIKIRKFLLSDLPEVMEIEKVSFPQPWPETYLKKLYKERVQDFLVAEVSRKVVGYILGYVKPDKSGSIKTLAVAPDYRRQGIGKKLVNFIIQKLKKKGIKEIFLHTRIKNRVASSFYKKLGFRTIKIIKRYFQNGEDAYLMRKEL